MSDNPQNNNPVSKPRKPLGKPLEWSDDDLDALAQVTPEDIEIAKATFRRNADPRYRNLLDAQIADDETLAPTEPPKPEENA